VTLGVPPPCATLRVRLPPLHNLVPGGLPVGPVVELDAVLAVVFGLEPQRSLDEPRRPPAVLVPVLDDLPRDEPVGEVVSRPVPAERPETHAGHAVLPEPANLAAAIEGVVHLEPGHEALASLAARGVAWGAMVTGLASFGCVSGGVGERWTRLGLHRRVHRGQWSGVPGGGGVMAQRHIRTCR
jgi:hypothetical protein